MKLHLFNMNEYVFAFVWGFFMGSGLKVKTRHAVFSAHFRTCSFR